MFNKEEEWKYIEEIPAKNVKHLQQAKKPPRYLSKEEIETLLDAADGIYKDMITIVLYTGFHIEEVFNLQAGC